MLFRRRTTLMYLSVKPLADSPSSMPRKWIRGPHLAIKILNASLDTRFGQKADVLDVVHFGSVPRLTCEDQYFAGDVRSAEVEPRIGLGVAFVLSLANDLGKLARAVIIIEHKIERSGKHCFDPAYFIAAAERSFRVVMTGRPAPTLVSKKKFVPNSRAVLFRAEYFAYSLEAAILLQAITETLRSSELAVCLDRPPGSR